MFLQVSVILFTRGGVCSGGVCSRVPGPGEVSGPRAVSAPVGCLVRGSAPRGVPGGDPPVGYCCGRYASYWNAFLLACNALRGPGGVALCL